NHRLGAGRPHDQPPVAVEALGAARDRGAVRGILVGLAVGVTYVLRDLRQRIETMAHDRTRLLLLSDHGEHLQRRDETIARGVVIRQNDVARRLATYVVTTL